jgi:hypothetical protein
MLRTRSKLFDHWIIRIGAIGLAAMSATALVAHAQNQQVLPGQPGADTTVAAVEARSAPYSVLGVSSNGMVTQKEVNPKTATALMKNAEPVSGVLMVLVHGNTAYVVHDMPMDSGQNFSGAMTRPIQ